MCQSDPLRLNDYVCIFLQLNGISYVCENYIEIREEYYLNKEQQTDSNQQYESYESRDN